MRAGHDPQLLDGTALRRFRRDAGWTLEDLSAASGISVSFLNDMEHSRRNGSVPTLVRICCALGCDPADLLHLEHATHV